MPAAFLNCAPAMNVVLAAINLYFIQKLLRERTDDQAYAVLPVREDDAYLNHFLTAHRADIDTFFPHFTGGVPDGRLTYLVQHGDETAGADPLDAGLLGVRAGPEEHGEQHRDEDDEHGPLEDAPQQDGGVADPDDVAELARHRPAHDDDDGADEEDHHGEDGDADADGTVFQIGRPSPMS